MCQARGLHCAAVAHRACCAFFAVNVVLRPDERPRGAPDASSVVVARKPRAGRLTPAPADVHGTGRSGLRCGRARQGKPTALAVVVGRAQLAALAMPRPRRRGHIARRAAARGDVRCQGQPVRAGVCGARRGGCAAAGAHVVPRAGDARPSGGTHLRKKAGEALARRGGVRAWVGRRSRGARVYFGVALAIVSPQARVALALCYQPLLL